MVESQVAIIPMAAAAGRHGGPTVASYHCSQMSRIGHLRRECTSARRARRHAVTRNAVQRHRPPHPAAWPERGLVEVSSTQTRRSCENVGPSFHSCVEQRELRSFGECRDGACASISEKTHAFDSANRPWLLPFIANKATAPSATFY